MSSLGENNNHFICKINKSPENHDVELTRKITQRNLKQSADNYSKKRINHKKEKIYYTLLVSIETTKYLKKVINRKSG